MTPAWLPHIRRLQAIAQTGLAYSRDPFDLERYAALREVAALLLADLSTGDPAAVESFFDGDTGYATPKVDVRAVVFDGGSVLMVRERSDGLWTLPGGWADVGASPGEVAEREVLEEAGLTVRASRLLAVYDRDRHGHPPMPHHVYKMFIRCEVTGGSLQPGTETSDASFFPESELPPLSVARVTAVQVRRMFEHHRDPALPADFD
jgi:ADP-ribose pyrophosphatase YjhB (NUDIX family)